MLIRADARQIPLVDGCVQCVVTSPPYWGLRDYGSAKWVGGDAACDHRKVPDPIAAIATSTLGGGKKTTGHLQEGYKGDCRRCGATRIDAQLGLEQTPDAYVASLVSVFAEVWRVLKADGTVWLNLGDSYAAMGRTERKESPGVGATQALRALERDVEWLPREPGKRDAKFRWMLPGGIKPKDLCGIPWRVAFALQAAGWYLRSDIIWSKPNPMPESVTDRPTKAHEYIFLLTKSERYFYNAAAVAERSAYGGEQLGIVRGQKRRAHAMGVAPSGNERLGADADIADTRNKRSVWHVATQPYSGSHFATFPEALIEPCILAGSRVGDLVYDPFIGSGTVGAVCDRLMRRWVGTDLSYQHLAKQRTAQRGLRLEIDEQSA